MEATALSGCVHPIHSFTSLYPLPSPPIFCTVGKLSCFRTEETWWKLQAAGYNWILDVFCWHFWRVSSGLYEMLDTSLLRLFPERNAELHLSFHARQEGFSTCGLEQDWAAYNFSYNSFICRPLRGRVMSLRDVVWTCYGRSYAVSVIMIHVRSVPVFPLAQISCGVIKLILLGPFSQTAHSYGQWLLVPHLSSQKLFNFMD